MFSDDRSKRQSTAERDAEAANEKNVSQPGSSDTGRVRCAFGIKRCYSTVSVKVVLAAMLESAASVPSTVKV